MVDVAIIGAGPYGLSLAAHLHGRGVKFRIFGRPMDTWLTQMPKGMRLKSEGFASSLSDPDSEFTLAHYCKEQGVRYADLGNPVPLATFIAYGLAFQKKLVPELEDKLVASVERSSVDYRIRLDDGEIVAARKVIVAVGISHFAHIPPPLSALPTEFVGHSSGHNAVDQFKGREVTVVGAGASAFDFAALLHQAGVRVQLVARTSAIPFHTPPAQQPRLWLQDLRYPRTGIGQGWKYFFYSRTPHLFHRLPERIRLDTVRKTLGPAPAWFVAREVVEKVPLNLGVNIVRAGIQHGRVHLELADGAGAQRTLVTDYVIAATGYKVDSARLTFLDAGIQSAIRSVERTPVLSSSFESSVPGLYFVGPAAANSFGPLLRFACGASFAARRLSRHLTRSVSRDPTGNRQALGMRRAVAYDDVSTHG